MGSERFQSIHSTFHMCNSSMKQRVFNIFVDQETGSARLDPQTEIVSQQQYLITHVCQPGFRILNFHKHQNCPICHGLIVSKNNVLGTFEIQVIIMFRKQQLEVTVQLIGKCACCKLFLKRYFNIKEYRFFGNKFCNTLANALKVTIKFGRKEAVTKTKTVVNIF